MRTTSWCPFTCSKFALPQPQDQQQLQHELSQCCFENKVIRLLLQLAVVPMLSSSSYFLFSSFPGYQPLGDQFKKKLKDLFRTQGRKNSLP